MKLFAILAIVAGVIYTSIIKAATFMCAAFLLTLAVVGLYDLLIHPFVKNRDRKWRAA
jgi:hypothetical protein